MEKMLSMICSELNNYFKVKSYDVNLKIENGNIIGMPELIEGQYFRLIGSVLSDGIYKYPVSGLMDEPEFHGKIWSMAIPSEVIDLSYEIGDWIEKYNKVDSSAMSPFNSESFGGYSYSKSSSNSNSGSSANSWQNIYKSRLNKYRKLRGIV